MLENGFGWNPCLASWLQREEFSQLEQFSFLSGRGEKHGQSLRPPELRGLGAQGLKLYYRVTLPPPPRPYHLQAGEM